MLEVTDLFGQAIAAIRAKSSDTTKVMEELSVTRWAAFVEVDHDSPSGKQLARVTRSLPGFGITIHNAETGRLQMQMQLDASTIRLATEVALRTAREAMLAAFDTVLAIRSIRALPEEDYLREIEHPAPSELMGPHEIAEYLGVSKQRVYDLQRTNSRFPSPIAHLAAGPVFTHESVEAFSRNWERKGGRQKKSD